MKGTSRGNTIYFLPLSRIKNTYTIPGRCLSNLILTMYQNGAPKTSLGNLFPQISTPLTSGSGVFFFYLIDWCFTVLPCCTESLFLFVLSRENKNFTFGRTGFLLFRIKNKILLSLRKWRWVPSFHSFRISLSLHKFPKIFMTINQFFQYPGTEFMIQTMY